MYTTEAIAGVTLRFHLYDVAYNMYWTLKLDSQEVVLYYSQGIFTD